MYEGMLLTLFTILILKNTQTESIHVPLEELASSLIFWFGDDYRYHHQHTATTIPVIVTTIATLCCCNNVAF